VASNADGNQKTSVGIAKHIADVLEAKTIPQKLKGQRAGTQFELAVASFLDETFPLLQTLRSGTWEVINVGGKGRRRRKRVTNSGKRRRKSDDINRISTYEPTPTSLI
jgi:hypothetical protein